MADGYDQSGGEDDMCGFCQQFGPGVTSQQLDMHYYQVGLAVVCLLAVALPCQSGACQMDVVCRHGSVVAVTVVRVASDRLVSVSFVLPVVCEGVLILGYIYPYV